MPTEIKMTYNSQMRSTILAIGAVITVCTLGLGLPFVILIWIIWELIKDM